MSILINDDTKVVVQGITGETARFHTKQMIEYGTNIYAGVTPKKKGQSVEGVPVFNTVQEAVQNTGVNTSVIYVPAAFAADAILEAVEAELELVICITEHIPVQDMLMVKQYMKGKKTKLIGPNCPGVISPEVSKIGIMPSYIHKRGHIGVVSRSGTLTYEAVHQLSKFNLGQSTAVGIGGDSVTGLSFIDILDMFNEDEDTYAVMMIGEIGGTKEEEAAKWIKDHMKKPVVGFVSGKTAPEGKRMGHAGAIISGNTGTAEHKIQTMKAYGITMAEQPGMLGQTMVDVLNDYTLLEKCQR